MIDIFQIGKIEPLLITAKNICKETGKDKLLKIRQTLEKNKFCYIRLR
jgi:hypothetical protein